ncbi:DNA translocase FtsK [Bdellovibrio svalbardensis]|uniref:DNA translocase FtsK 4TM domain-containing protein n=1 Tax=Bdellovibrio svalbardensis TaxID=2972972 RepID=A0ABT6DDF9_9BACT|nr:DNA translocase FtsK [Bdellovibrio svalbardensis]MDG0814882.1 DNA translocase FtsK 4TM domain-containing protein [Bdellovibrio svalbardensis]
MNQFLKKFRQDVIAIGFLGLGLFLALALISYSPRDPSLNSIGQGLKAANYCGIVGSFLADMLYQFLGLAAWVLVGSLLKMAYASFKGESLNLKNIRFVWALLLIINVAALLSLYLPNTKLFQNQIYLGGLLGLGVAQALMRAFASAGVQVILWSFMAVLVVFYSEKTLQELAEIPQEFFADWKKKKYSDKIGSFFSGMFVGDSGAKKAKPVKKEKKEEKEEKRDMSKAQQLVFPLSDKKFKEDAEDEEEDEDLEAILAADAEDETEEEDDEEEVPAVRLAQKRKVVMKAKPPRRIENWEMPKLSLLEDPPASRIKIDKAEIQRKADSLVEKLKNFSIEGQITDAKPGPLVTMYEFKPNADVKISKISELEDDLSLALSSESVRVVGHIPGTDVVGIETANLKRETVYYKDLIAEDTFWSEDLALPMAVGRAVDGEPKIVDLRKMPHLLIAGTTGSGKSVFVGSIISGLLFRHSPKTLRLVLIDPKMVDLAPFAGVPHLALPHITEPKKAATALKWAVREMEKRYKSLSKFGVGKIELFNEKTAKMSKADVDEHERHNIALEEGKAKLDQYYYQPLPYVVIVVDELADLMIVEKQNIEEPIQRLTQKARACGIHLILATQSPRKDVVTGLIKTNIPGRVALKVASKMDSRIIIDDSGAERLLPNGDMLFQAPGIGKPTRHHGPYMKDSEIANVVKHWSDQAEPEYDPLAMRALEGFAGGDSESGGDGGDGGGFGDEEYDERYDEILSWASSQKEISASLIQRKFRLGYPRAARMIEVFEKEGVVGPANGSKPRQVLVSSYSET